MLRIRKEQVKAFEEEAERRYREKLAKALPKAWPGLCLALGEEGVRFWVEKGFRKGRAYGIRNVNNLTRFVHLMFLLKNDDFDTEAGGEWAGRILSWKNASEDLKLAALEKRAREAPGPKD